MIGDLGTVELSRLQFAITALYHFLFVPLTLGLGVILAIMETIYVVSKKEIWRDMTKFWGKLFAINFAMGVATGITMEFQFGTNWAYYSHFVGDIFGVPLAIEGLMAFFLESTFVGMFLFGWERLSKKAHLTVTWLMALGTNLSALWILIANGWMQNPVGAKFNASTMRMELTSFYDIFFNEVAQSKFVHTISAGYVVGSMFVLSVSCYYILRGKDLQIAKRSSIIAAAFGLLSAASVIVLGDESGYTAAHNQKMKLAAIEGMWETVPAPAPLTVFAIPNKSQRKNEFEVSVPYLLGLIATRSTTKEVAGINNLETISKQRIINGISEYKILKRLRDGSSLKPEEDKKFLEKNFSNLGYALLLKKYRPDIENANLEEIAKAAADTIPNVAVLFFSFRIMAGLGMFFITLFAFAFYSFLIRGNFTSRKFLTICLFSLPLPWIASECGWIVAEYGRQPWVIEGILPTALATSGVAKSNILISLFGFVVLYSSLLAVDLYLMFKTVRAGPSKLIKSFH